MSAASTPRSPAWSGCAAFLRAAILLAVAALPSSGRCAGLAFNDLSVGPPQVAGGAVGPVPQSGVFNPAASAFSSLLSYGAMSVLAPIVFGDFQSPTTDSSSFGAGAVGPVPQTIGVDPAVSTMLSGMLGQPQPPGGESPEAEEFDVGSGGAAVASGGGVVDPGVGVADATGVIPVSGTAGELPAVSTAGGVQPVCDDDHLAAGLQAGGEFWNAQERGAAPVQLPRGVFTGAGYSPRGLAPSGNPSNVVPPGPAGGWCRGTPGPFSQSSPLESHGVWIATAILLVGVFVFWLSRGIALPTREGGWAARRSAAAPGRRGWP